jgi:hypothetical protein
LNQAWNNGLIQNLKSVGNGLIPNLKWIGNSQIPNLKWVDNNGKKPSHRLNNGRIRNQW